MCDFAGADMLGASDEAALAHVRVRTELDNERSNHRRQSIQRHGSYTLRSCDRAVMKRGKTDSKICGKESWLAHRSISRRTDWILAHRCYGKATGPFT